MNATDIQGTDIDINKINLGLTYYSCNCGWLDLTHAKPENAHILLLAISHALNLGLYSDPTSGGVAFQYTVGADSGSYLQDSPPVGPGALVFGNEPRLPWYFVSKNRNVIERDLIAFSIFLDLVDFIEGREANSSLDAYRFSGQSVEDLPSYYLAFFLAKKLEQFNTTDSAYGNRTDIEIGNFMTSLAKIFLPSCNILSSSQSLDVLQNAPQTARPKNPTFLPVNRADVPYINNVCGSNTPRNNERLPQDIFTIQIGSIPLNMISRWETIRNMGKELRVDRSEFDCKPMTIPDWRFSGDTKRIELFECKRLTTAQANEQLFC